MTENLPPKDLHLQHHIYRLKDKCFKIILMAKMFFSHFHCPLQFLFEHKIHDKEGVLQLSFKTLFLCITLGFLNIVINQGKNLAFNKCFIFFHDRACAFLCLILEIYVVCSHQHNLSLSISIQLHS
jgi:hypothetical protein